MRFVHDKVITGNAKMRNTEFLGECKIQMRNEEINFPYTIVKISGNDKFIFDIYKNDTKALQIYRSK